MGRRSIHSKSKLLDPKRFAPTLLVALYNKYSAEVSSACRRRFGLGVADCRIVGYLGMHDSGTGAEISNALQTDKALTSRSLARLRARGMISTGEIQGRSAAMLLTDEGLSLFEDLLLMALAQQDALLDGFDEEERRTLVDLLTRMIANVPKVAKLTTADSEAK